jgi:hypothetical protein
MLTQRDILKMRKRDEVVATFWNCSIAYRILDFDIRLDGVLDIWLDGVEETARNTNISFMPNRSFYPATQDCSHKSHFAPVSKASSPSTPLNHHGRSVLLQDSRDKNLSEFLDKQSDTHGMSWPLQNRTPSFRTKHCGVGLFFWPDKGDMDTHAARRIVIWVVRDSWNDLGHDGILDSWFFCSRAVCFVTTNRKSVGFRYLSDLAPSLATSSMTVSSLQSLIRSIQSRS